MTKAVLRDTQEKAQHLYSKVEAAEVRPTRPEAYYTYTDGQCFI